MVSEDEDHELFHKCLQLSTFIYANRALYNFTYFPTAREFFNSFSELL